MKNNLRMWTLLALVMAMMALYGAIDERRWQRGILARLDRAEARMSNISATPSPIAVREFLEM